MGNGILSALSDEFYKMGTFADDYYKNIIMPYKEGLTSKPGFLQSMKNWRPWNALPGVGGTWSTGPTPAASTFLRGAGKLLGPASYFISSPVNAGEDARMAEINQRWANQQNQNNVNQSGFAGSGFTPPSRPKQNLPPQGAAGFNTGGIVSLWQR
jgi:hypothetical protein|tara:strand:+ start:54 stop:518 length:465 start_codon:yes stop_codon:yes gene_type:complete